MPDKKPTPKGKGLKKKYGPFPAYVYLGLGAVVVLGYLYYRNKQANSGPEAGSLNQQIIPSGAVVPVSGNNAGSTPNESPDNSITTPTDYITNTDLQNGLDNLNSEVGAQIAAITFPTPVVNENITVHPSTVAKQTAVSKTAAKKATASSTKSTPIKYFTKKTQVHLRAGQKLHFTKGKGYYAA